MSNPDGCSCEHVHRSNPTCPSTAPSHGAIPDTDLRVRVRALVGDSVPDDIIDAAIDWMRTVEANFIADRIRRVMMPIFSVPPRSG